MAVSRGKLSSVIGGVKSASEEDNNVRMNELNNSKELIGKKEVNGEKNEAVKKGVNGKKR